MADFGKLAQRTAYNFLKDSANEIRESFGDAAVSYVTLRLLDELWLGSIISDFGGGHSDDIAESLGWINRRANAVIKIALDDDLDKVEKVFRMISVQYYGSSKPDKFHRFLQSVTPMVGKDVIDQNREDYNLCEEFPDLIKAFGSDIQGKLQEIISQYSDREYLPEGFDNDPIFPS